MILTFEESESEKAEFVKGIFKNFILSKKLKILVNKDGRGFTSCLNYGIINSSADYIFRIDTDDKSIESRYDYQINLLYKNKKLLCYSDLIDSKKNIIIRYPDIKKFHFFILLGMNPIPHVSICMKRNVFNNKFGFYNEKLLKSEDFELWIRFLEYHGLNGILKCDRPVTFYNTVGSYEKSRKSAISQIKIRILNLKSLKLGFVLVCGILPNLLRIAFPKLLIF